VNELDDAQKIDFNMTLKSKGLNKMIKYLSDKMPDKPNQRSYRQRLRDCLRVVIVNLYSTENPIRYNRSDHSPEYNLKKYSAKKYPQSSRLP
jgi:hypothetical protein